MRSSFVKTWSAFVASVATIAFGMALAEATKAQQPVAQQGTVRFELMPTGNQARYRVREQLLSIKFPSDAVGTTSAITGSLVFDATGKVVSGQSKFRVDLTGLKSDSAMRDRIIQGRTLHTAQFPAVELTVKDLPGLKFPLPATGEIRFQLVGDLTIHGVTKPATWAVTATPKEGGLAGTSTTSFTFEDFGMTRPTGASVLTVENLIKLEFDFHLVPAR